MRETSEHGDLSVSEPRQELVSRAGEIKLRLIELNKSGMQVVAETAMLLKEFKDNHYYKELGHKTFDDAVNALQDEGQLDFGARQARYLLAIGELIAVHGLVALKDVSISKAREIASVKAFDDQVALLEAAKTRPYSEIQAAAKRIRDKAAGRDEDPLDPVTLLMTATQKQFYKECIELGRKLASMNADVPDVAVLVDVVLADWRSGAEVLNG